MMDVIVIYLNGWNLHIFNYLYFQVRRTLYFEKFYRNLSVMITPIAFLKYSQKGTKKSQSDAYSKSCKTSNMERFVNIANGFQSLDILAKKTPSQTSGRVVDTPVIVAD